MKYTYEQIKQAQEALESRGFYHSDCHKTGGVVGIWDRGNEFYTHIWKHDTLPPISFEIDPQGNFELPF